jgi:ADP-L-glycero-D-manno-heptose 6-epimerase
MKTFLVTGTKGFIGSNIANYLLSQQNQVVSIDDEYIDENWMSNLDKIFSSHTFDAVFHVGACSNTLEQDVNYMMLRNYETTKHIVRWTTSKNIPVIFSSSAANYGTNNLYPSNLYGWSKYVAEDYVIKNGGIALRYFNVYGPGENNKGPMASVAYQSYIKHKNDIEVQLFPKYPKRDFVYINDVVDANFFAYTNYDKFTGHYYEVGSGTANTFESVMNFMEIPFEYTDEHKIPQGYQFFTCSNSQKWMNGWVPQWNLERGIKNYKEYLNGLN